MLHLTVLINVTEKGVENKGKLKRQFIGQFWLEKWKGMYGFRETRITGEVDDVSIVAEKSWIERIPELVSGYKLEDMWNMDELGLFFKLLPDKGLIEMPKTKKGDKKAKVRLMVAFFVNADGQKVDKPVIIWKSKKPRCFKNLKGRDLSRPLGVHYFANNKAWMKSEIMSGVLKRLERKIKRQNRNVVLFLDNATSHEESIEKSLSNIKLVFLPKSTTSRLQPLDGGIIRAFKLKYRKLLIRYVISRVDYNDMI